MSAAAIRQLTPRQEAMKLTWKQVSLPWLMYIRVSTKDQGEMYSPASQRATLLRLASDIGVNVPEGFILIDKKTGKNFDRPDYQRLMELVSTKQVGGVLALCLDRVARDVVGAIEFRRMLKGEGAALAFALQQFDDSPQGRMMYNQFATFAEYEAELIIQRTSKGRLQKAKEGHVNGGECHTYGYLYHPGGRLTGGAVRKGYIEPHPFEADVVKRLIFEAYAEHGSAFRIQIALNRAGILTKHGKLWSNFTVLKVLRNRIYTGQYVTTVKGEDLRPESVTLKVPALIDKALFDKVQVMLARHKDRAGRPSTSSPLSGKIHCACTLPSGQRCKRRWVLRKKGAFSCSNMYDNRTREKLCIDSTQVRAALIEDLVIDGVRDRIRQPETAYRLAKEYHAEITRAKPDAVSVETQLARLKERYDRTEAIVFANVPQRTRDKAAQQLLEIEAERQTLEVEAREAAVVALPSRDRIVDTCVQLKEGLDGLKTFDERRKFVLKTVEKVETDGRDFTVYCRIELAPAASASGSGNGQVAGGLVDHFAFVIRGKVA